MKIIKVLVKIHIKLNSTLAKKKYVTNLLVDFGLYTGLLQNLENLEKSGNLTFN